MSKKIILFLKGMAMGAADVVPGVSGGTIAFISGIYERLIRAIHKLGFSFFGQWKKEGFASAWKTYNLTFLSVLLAGIGVSILSLARVVTHLLDTQPIGVWSFFFGLILASAIYIGRMIRPWSRVAVVVVVAAAGLSFLITLATPTSPEVSNGYLIFTGFVAIIAMILPGVSGSFILLLLGAYEAVINTVDRFREGLTTLDYSLLFDSGIKLACFALGAVIGIKVFSRILNWLFTHHKNLTLAVLTGFMLGALNKVWPWKAAETEVSVWPGAYSGDSQTVVAIVAVLVGFMLIFALELAAWKKRDTR